MHSAFKLATELNPENPYYNNSLAYAYVKAELYDDAQAAFELAEEVARPDNLRAWKFEGTKAWYEAGAMAEGYSIEDNKIVYSEATEGTVMAELDGVNFAPTFNETNDVIQITEDNFTDEGVTVSSNAGGYGFEIAEGSYSFGKFSGSDAKDVITNNGGYLNIDAGAGKDSIVNNAINATLEGGAGNDKIINNAKNVELIGGKGNDNITVSGGEVGNIFSYSKGDGKDILFSFDEKDSIRITDDSAVEANIDGNDIQFKVGTGSITIQDGATTRREVLFVDSDGNEIETLSGNEYTTDGIISYDAGGEAGIVLTSTFRRTYTASEVARVDGSKTRKGIGIDASTEGSTLIGGAGKDTLISGENDFELTGGKGNDIFTYNGGRGTIKDYSQKGTFGKDKIAFGEGLAVQEYEIQAQNVVLGFSESDSLTIEGGTDAAITFGAKNSTVNYYTTDGIYDEKKKAVTLASDKADFDASKQSKLVTIDASAADDEISIVGNKKANYIVAGDNGSTLNGGKGKDTLVGGDESDIFVFENKSGNKVISNYDNDIDTGDQISLGSGANLLEVTKKGSNLVLKAGKNKITIENGVENGQGKIFTFTEFVEDENGEQKAETKTFDNGLLLSADRKKASITSAVESREIYFGDGIYANVENLSAELLKKAVQLYGDADANELIGGKSRDYFEGGDGSDTLRGGKGNDTLWGGSPNGDYNDADTFVFWAGDGNDTIMDYSYAQDDMLQILDKNGNKEAAFSGEFDDDKLTLKVKGGGKVILADTAGQTQFNINNTTYTRQGNTLVK